ncbi:lipoprotein [Mycoplasma putrefaciens]|uniref:lipoprotein n=1 Tax=Mycoplasma putrefaciens TaxID=2123 RepID=UPI003DA4EBCC
MKLNRKTRLTILIILICSCISSTAASIYFSKIFTVNSSLIENQKTLSKPIIGKNYISKILTSQNTLDENKFKAVFLTELKKQNKDLKFLDDVISFQFNKTEVGVIYKNYKWFYKIVYNNN